MSVKYKVDQLDEIRGYTLRNRPKLGYRTIWRKPRKKNTDFSINKEIETFVNVSKTPTVTALVVSRRFDRGPKEPF